MSSKTPFRAMGAGLLFLLFGFTGPLIAQAQASPPQKAPAAKGPAKEKGELRMPDANWTGDFDEMKKRRTVRVLAVYNKTNYFIDKGTPRGITVEVFKMFEDSINQKYKTTKLPIHVVLIPVRRAELGELLLAGRGDIVAAGITVTPERLAKVDFSNPTADNVNEIVVSGPASEPVASREDLSGREVFVREHSIFHESLEKLNAELKQSGKAPVKLRFAPEELEDEDLLEMLNAGLVQYVVTNDFLARFWAGVLPKLKLHPDIVLRKDASLAWAIRKNSPLLKAELDAFIAKYPKGSAVRNQLFQKYLKSTKFVKNAAAKEEMEKFEKLVEYFKTYSDQYDMSTVYVSEFFSSEAYVGTTTRRDPTILSVQWQRWQVSRDGTRSPDSRADWTGFSVLLVTVCQSCRVPFIFALTKPPTPGAM